jgi:putative membrane protein
MTRTGHADPRPAARRLRHAALATAVAGLLLLGLGAPATGDPPAAAGGALARLAGADAQPAELVNDEVAVATLDPTGLPERALLISRVTASGPAREVVDPASATNVRYLDRLGRPEVTAEGVVLTVGGQRPSALTEARFDKPLPVALHAEYTLDGSIVPAADVPGADADVGVTYTLTNTTAERVDLAFSDAAGEPATASELVFAPFQGVLTVTMPEDSRLVDDGGAMLATDAQGRTLARWNVALYPPVSSPVQRIGFTLRTPRAAIPAVAVELTPATLDQDPATGFAADLLLAATQGNAELHSGLAELDRNALGLASGSDQLAVGLANLSGGATGVAGASASLVAGLDDLTGGARDLAGANAELAAALATATAGAESLAEATAELAGAGASDPGTALEPLQAGGRQIEAGLLEATARVGSPEDPVLDLTTPIPPDGDAACPPGATAPPDDDCVTIYQGVRALRDGLVAVEAVVDAILGRADAALEAAGRLAEDIESIATDSGAAAQGAADLYASLCSPPIPTLDPASCAQLLAVAEAAGSATGTAVGTVPTVTDLLTAIGTLQGQADAIQGALDTAVASTERLLAAVAALGAALGPGTPEQPGLAAGMAELNRGLDELAAVLADGQVTLAAALDAVAAGSDELADGIGDAAEGASDLAGGSSALADGVGEASSGAAALDEGAAGLAGGADAAAAAGADLASGARALQRQGTAPAAAGVLDASTTPALADAWLAAAAERAADALPYGAPLGADGNVAYVFTIEEVPAPRSLWERITGMFG